MSAPHNPRIVERAKEMWTEEGLSPQQILDQLNYEVHEGLLNVTEGTAVPLNKSSINRWAKAGNWEPHWKDVKAAKNEPAPQEEMSVVEQVLYHLAENRAFNKANEYTHKASLDGITPNPFRTSSTEQVLMAIQMDLAYEYNPPPVVFRTLRPKLRARIRREKNSAALMEKASKESDGTLQEIVHGTGGEIVRIVKAPEGRGMQEILAEALANGIEIDDGHAGLGIVYTNPEEQEVDEESE